MGETNKDISRRFVAAFEFIEHTKGRLNRSLIGREIGKKPQTITEVLKGRSYVSLELLQYFFRNFNLNPTFIFVDENAPILLPKASSGKQDQQQSVYLENEVAVLRDKMKRMEDNHESIEERLKMLIVMMDLDKVMTDLSIKKKKKADKPTY